MLLHKSLFTRLQRLTVAADLGRCRAPGLANLPHQLDRGRGTDNELGCRFACRGALLNSPDQTLT